MNITKSNSMKLGYAGGGGESEGQTFVVHKDTNGYGLTLFGYRPVFVQTVKAKGAADRAGIKERDIILQVNGINVTESSHDEVVDIIKGDKYVALTISRMKNESHSQLSSCSTSSTTLPHYVPSSILSHSNTSIVTAPQPPNSEAVRILTDEKYHTIQLMAEQERRNVDGLRQNLVTLQPESDESLKKQEELELALRRLIKLEEQLEQMREKVQTPNRTVPRPSSSSDIPPPLPARNKNMTSPSLSSSSSVPPPPTLPPRQVRTLPPLPPPIKPSTSFNFSRIESQQHPPCKSPTMSNLSDPPDSPRYETPPGTPPPPYALKGFSTTEKSPGGTTHFQLTQESILKSPFNLSDHFNTGAEILNMEDDDDDDDELSDHDSSRRPAHHKSITTLDEKVSDVDGPFNNLRDLLCHHAHLSVFLNFVISISDPAPLLFYLITDSYKQGSLKEMQRWAYEIHSSFLVPGAPLPINKIENNTVNVIDRALQEEFEKEEILRRLFWKVRLKCRKDIKYQLLSFCEKKDNGLGGIFGHSELELRQCIDNRNRELQVIDNLMIPLLDSLTEDLDNATERSFTIASSLATILSKTFVTRNPTALSLIEKCPTFVSKEKKSNKLFGRNKKSLQVQGHNFELKQYYEVTYCNQSQIMIWGIGPQGYRCSNCGFDVYRKYVQHVEETCVATGPSSRRKTRGGVFSRILSDRDLSAAVHPWKSTTQSPNTTKEIIPSSSICNDDFLDDPNSTLLSVSSALLFDQTGGLESSKSNAAALPPSSGNSTTANTEGKGGSLHDLRSRDSKMDEARGHSREQIGKKVGRAQSCKLEKEQPKSRASNRERRKHSDPNIPRQTSSDVEGGGGVGVGGGGSSGANPSQAAISNQPSGSSSTSSLSARSSLDSPAGSLQEMVSSSNPNSNLSTSSRGGGSNNGSGGGVPPLHPRLFHLQTPQLLLVITTHSIHLFGTLILKQNQILPIGVFP
ncbi:uncharacterized protein [Lepeophtheirus salmonis]|uniref:uncharacterized protein isoform X2 n=1 Tax=Lepeophtheirus salmonis TaxID=72036 RepID=UPI001AE42AF5|nr:rho guanine nucleotide exchange factor 11-like isoform X2 [Lepeophtheirus salmonis]